MPHDLPPWLFNVIFPVNRWIHLVASTLIVGGVLFFEFVVPVATADLKPEQQLAVFGRARWVFRKVVWMSVIALLCSGAVSMWRMWRSYKGDQFNAGGFWFASGPWVAGHIVLALVGVLIAFRITSTRRLHERPVGWMQFLLVILLVCIFAASVARHVRLHMREWRESAPAFGAMAEDN